MNNKQQITANNAELQKHKQDILDLPMADDVKNGRYVWERREYFPAGIRIGLKFTGTIPPVSGAKESIIISNANFDVSKITDFKTFFNGFKAPEGIARFEINKYGNLMVFKDGLSVGAEVEYFNPSESELILGVTASTITERVYDFTCETEKEAPDGIGAFLGYTVSDNETAYPDGGEKDGYWYKRVEAMSGIDYGEVTLTSSNAHIVVSHNLHKVPNRVYLVPEQGINSNTNHSHASIYGQLLYFDIGYYRLTNHTLRYLTIDENTIDFGTAGSSFKKGTYKWFALA